MFWNPTEGQDTPSRVDKGEKVKMRVERCAKTRLCTAWGPAKSLGFILTAVKSHGGTRIRREMQ